VIAPIFIAACLSILPGGGAAGGDAIYCNGGDIIGPRNIQLGSNSDPNGDIGAGSATLPGRLSFCWDLCGHGLVIYDSRKEPLASFGPGPRTVLYGAGGHPLVEIGPGKRIVFLARPRYDYPHAHKKRGAKRRP